MKEWASKEDTVNKLLELGFVPGPRNGWFTCKLKNKAVARIYECRNGYYCVSVDDAWLAPIVWKGPKADWDKVDCTDEFIDFLNEFYPGWR